MSARFVYRPLSSEQMATIGNLMIGGVSVRIHKGLSSSDEPAKPLKPGRGGRRGYPDYKLARGLQAIRDLFWRGLTMRSLRVTSSKANEVRIGFDNPEASRIAAINNSREPMFWFSPGDQQRIQELVSQAIHSAETVQVRKVA
jgi:hypothetical protein